MKYEVVKRWVTGDRAEKDDAEIQVELEIEMCNLMELSRQKSFPGHKALATDLGLWKLGSSHTTSNMMCIVAEALSMQVLMLSPSCDLFRIHRASAVRAP